MEKPCVKTYLFKDIFGFGIGFGFVLGFDAWKNFGFPSLITHHIHAND
jgi:hypothetical protein